MGQRIISELHAFQDRTLFCANNYSMPKLDGVEFVHRFLKLPGKEDVPVLMLTGTAGVQVRFQALMAGVTEFMEKPFEAMKLIKWIEKLIVPQPGVVT